jgi:hypothetical protein
MTKYNKLIGAALGSIAALLISIGLLPAEYATPQIISTLTGVLAMAATFFVPANA